MADVRCPKCGRATNVLTAKADDRRYHVCVNYPGCRGRVPFDEGWGHAPGKARPVTRPAHDRPRQRREAPSPEGGFFIDEAWGDDWSTDNSATNTDYGRPLQRREPASYKSGAGASFRGPGQDELEFNPGRNRPVRRGKLSFDDVWDDDWGHDWDEDKPAPKTVPYAPQYPRAQRRQATPEINKPPRPRHPIASRKEAPSRVKEPLELQQPQAPELAAYRPQYKRPPKAYVAPDKEKPSELQGSHESQRRPFLNLYKKTPKVYVAPEQEDPKQHQQQVRPKPESATGRKGASRPRWGRAPEEEAISNNEEIPDLLRPAAPHQAAAPDAKRPPSARKWRVPQEFLVPERKRRSMAVIIIALIVAFLAIDGMIYAAFVLR